MSFSRVVSKIYGGTGPTALRWGVSVRFNGYFLCEPGLAGYTETYICPFCLCYDAEFGRPKSNHMSVSRVLRNSGGA